MVQVLLVLPQSLPPHFYLSLLLVSSQLTQTVVVSLLTYPILSIMARDIMSVTVSTVSSESCFSLSGRILEEQQRRLLLENMEMLTYIKNQELGVRREQHEVEVIELEVFKNMFFDEEEGTGGGGAVS